MLSETEWVLSNDGVIRDVVGGLGSRRMRLLAVACCRTLVPGLTAPDDRIANEALDAVELFADTGKTKAGLRRARQAVRGARHRVPTEAYHHALVGNGHAILWAVEVAATENVPHTAVLDVLPAIYAVEDIGEETARRRLYGFYRDLAGRPPGLAFDPAWRTSTVVALAERMYESRDFAAMPILADALQDAGCDSDDVLSHCRGDGPHVRGCWAIDAILGKE